MNALEEDQKVYWKWTERLLMIQNNTIELDEELKKQIIYETKHFMEIYKVKN